MHLSRTLAAITLLAMAAAPSAPSLGSQGVQQIDTEDDCYSLAPPAFDDIAIPLFDDTTTVVPLHVRVLLDVAEAPTIIAQRADADPDNDAAADALFAEVVEELAPVFEGARETYARLAIDLKLSYDLLTVRDDVPSSTVELMADAKMQVGGAVPEGVDVIYVATDNLVDGTTVGQADCVGGMAYDNHSFAAGRVERPPVSYDFTGTGAVVLLARSNMIVFAHEVGHLLGAHHHATNCVESLLHYPGLSDAMAVCGLMINDAGLAGDVFSSVNGAVVRGYANSYAGQQG